MAYNDENYGNALEQALAKIATRHAVGEMWVGFSVAEKPAGVLLRDASLQSRGVYASLWQWAQDKGLVLTEAEWQAEYAANGVCHKYSAGNGSTTFRMPSAPLYIKGAENAGEAGAYVAEGLPDVSHSHTRGTMDITGSFDMINHNPAHHVFTGAFNTGTVGDMPVVGIADDGAWCEGWGTVTESFTASNSWTGSTSTANASNPIYGASAHVTPATSKLLFGVWAISTAGVAIPDTNAEEILAEAQKAVAVANLAAVPAGTTIAFASNSEPEGYLLCNGATVSRTTYAALFAAIGTTYGVGDGSTTFHLPNLMDKFIQGSGTAGSVKSAGLPNITGHIGMPVHDFHQNTVDGCFDSIDFQAYVGNRTADVVSHGTQTVYGYAFDASRSNSVYGNSSTVQPPALTMRYYIKY